jgi:hypothetical protein
MAVDCGWLGPNYPGGLIIEGKYKEVGNQTLEEFLSISRQQNTQNFIQN